MKHRRIAQLLVAALALFGLVLGAGCSKEGDDKPKSKCKKGQLEIPTKMSADMAPKGVPTRHECPTRLSTSGPRPPVDSWVGGAEPFWGPELIVLLDKEKTAAARKAGSDECIFTWSQGCSEE